jgi:uncharacterized protein YndB with AHSA1/START domain
VLGQRGVRLSSIRRQINIVAAPRAIWNAFTSVDGWESWYADEARIDPREGGRVTLTTEGDDGEPVQEVGMIHTCRPTSRLEISWDSNSPAPTRGSRLSVQIARDGDETRVAIVQSGGEILQDEEAREQLDNDWRRALLALRGVFEG